MPVFFYFLLIKYHQCFQSPIASSWPLLDNMYTCFNTICAFIDMSTDREKGQDIGVPLVAFPSHSNDIKCVKIVSIQVFIWYLLLTAAFKIWMKVQYCLFKKIMFLSEKGQCFSWFSPNREFVHYISMFQFSAVVDKTSILPNNWQKS